MKASLAILDAEAIHTDRHISTTPEVDALLAANAPVAIGVSGGKDSCAAAISFVRYLKSVGHSGKVLLIHSNLGRVEWIDSLPTCERLAGYLGVELVVVRRKAGDMMDRWLTRWKNNVARYIDLMCVKVILPWSTPSMRFCTSELKTAVICRELIRRFPGEQILSVSGVRRQESNARAKAPIAKNQPKLTSKTHRTSGIDLNVIADWTIADVFAFLREAGFRLHDAYTRYNSSRVSCAFCIMGSDGDLHASAAVPEHLPLLREMVGLEIVSTFAFQSGKWLGDIAPHILSPGMRLELERAQERASIRERLESVIPKHLLYTKGWPTCMPTMEEASMLASVRTQVGSLLGLPVRYIEAKAVYERYAELMAQNEQRKAA